MSQPYLGEIRIVSFSFPPKGWAFCNGQTMSIQQNSALFAILGTTYGGNGVQTFALPNLQGRIPYHVGNGLVLGETGGESAHTLNISELPAHNHVPVGSKSDPSAAVAAGNLWARNNASPYAASPNNNPMNPQCVQPAGGNQPHNNLPPFLVLNFVVALVGVFPSRN
jgi:microcystin-dependent protein